MCGNLSSVSSSINSKENHFLKYVVQREFNVTPFWWFMLIGNGDNKDPDSGGQKDKKKLERKTLLSGNIVF